VLLTEITLLHIKLCVRLRIQQTQETNTTTEFKSFILSYFQEKLKIITHTHTHTHTQTIYIPAVLNVKSNLPKSEEQTYNRGDREHTAELKI